MSIRNAVNIWGLKLIALHIYYLLYVKWGFIVRVNFYKCTIVLR